MCNGEKDAREDRPALVRMARLGKRGGTRGRDNRPTRMRRASVLRLAEMLARNYMHATGAWLSAMPSVAAGPEVF